EGIAFQPKAPDQDDIKRSWDSIVTAFPDLGAPARKNNSPLARFFRIRMAPQDFPDELQELEAEAEGRGFCSGAAQSLLEQIRKKTYSDDVWWEYAPLMDH